MQALIRTGVGALVREGTPVLKVVQDAAEPNATGRSLIDEIVRDGARAMLAAALQAEVTAYVAGTPTSSTSRITGWLSATATTPSGR